LPYDIRCSSYKYRVKAQPGFDRNPRSIISGVH
jgi:hypothetical protein